MAVCDSALCGAEAQSQHSPCCSSHERNLCCRHYCRTHFVQVDPCDPVSHQRKVS